MALLPADSPATIDADFAKDVEAAIEAHREPSQVRAVRWCPTQKKDRPHCRGDRNDGSSTGR
jgi:hypothetical protein